MNLSNKLQSNNPIFDNYLSCLPTNLTHRDMLTKYEKSPPIFIPKALKLRLLLLPNCSNYFGKAKKGETCVLGLPTGSTQIGIYAELVRLHREEGLSFKNVITFNLDEYYPISLSHCRATIISCEPICLIILICFGEYSHSRRNNHS